MLLEKIKKLCEQNNTTIAQLERAIEVSNGSIRKWEKSCPSIDKVIKVANYFNVAVDYLLSEKTLSKETLEVAEQFESFSAEQRNLVKCYIMLVKDKQAS